MSSENWNGQWFTSIESELFTFVTIWLKNICLFPRYQYPKAIISTGADLIVFKVNLFNFPSNSGGYLQYLASRILSKKYQLIIPRNPMGKRIGIAIPWVNVTNTKLSMAEYLNQISKSGPLQSLTNSLMLFFFVECFLRQHRNPESIKRFKSLMPIQILKLTWGQKALISIVFTIAGLTCKYHLVVKSAKDPLNKSPRKTKNVPFSKSALVSKRIRPVLKYYAMKIENTIIFISCVLRSQPIHLMTWTLNNLMSTFTIAIGIETPRE